MADIHILVADDSAGQRLDAYLGANDGCPTRSACAHLIEAVRCRQRRDLPVKKVCRALR